MDWKLIDKALKFASITHMEDKRKGTDIPYISHPVAVSMMLLQAGYNDEVVVAGLLHDSLEDTPVTVEQIEENFGNHVKSIVEGCSELDKSLSWEERKRHTIEYLESAPNEIRWVTCADKLHNARSMYEDYQAHGENIWSRFKRGREQQEWYYTSIIESLSQGEPFGLIDELRNEVRRLFGKT